MQACLCERQRFLGKRQLNNYNFDYTKMGSNNSMVTIVIETEKSFYLPGECVQGNVFIRSPKPYPCSKIIMVIDGTESCEWKGETHGQKPNQPIVVNGGNPNKGGAKIIDTNFILCGWNNESYLHGQYAFPFMFMLPYHIPGSYLESKAQYRGEIKYQMRCVSISPRKEFQHVEKVQELIVREPQKSQEEMLYGETIIYPKTCWFRNHGVSKVCCYFEKNYYMPGENCVAICQVDNFKSSLALREVKCEFIKIVTLNSHIGTEKKITTCINSVRFPGLAAFTSYTQENACRVPIPLHYTNKEKIHPSTSGRYVKCEYFIQVTPIFSGCCMNNTQYFAVKVHILQEGLLQPKIEAPTNWNPEIYKKSEIILNYRQNNDLYDSMVQENQ